MNVELLEEFLKADAPPLANRAQSVFELAHYAFGPLKVNNMHDKALRLQLGIGLQTGRTL